MGSEPRSKACIFVGVGHIQVKVTSDPCLVVRKPVFRVSDQVRHKPGCTATEDGWRLEISDLGSRGIDCTIRVAKTKALISFAVTAKLIWVFVFAYAKSRFSHNEAQVMTRNWSNQNSNPDLKTKMGNN